MGATEAPTCGYEIESLYSSPQAAALCAWHALPFHRWLTIQGNITDTRKQLDGLGLDTIEARVQSIAR
jgi:hypothetical protein